MQNKENDLFHFSRKEKNGILMVLILNLLIYFWPDVYDYFFNHTSAVQIESLPVIAEEHQENRLHSTLAASPAQKETAINENNNIHYFEFDPNTCTKKQWIQLGVKEKTVETIGKYLAKGGKFKTPEDLKKIWGLQEKKVNELIPFVKIRISETVKNENKPKVIVAKSSTLKIIDLNTADSAALEWLPGIGPGLTKRIINYRNKLGGFYSVDQLSEVWGLPDTVFQKIKNRVVVSGNVDKININTADFLTLKSHPYVGNKLANAIINYRKQHGNFISLEDIQKIVVIDEKTFNLLSHYLITNR